MTKIATDKSEVTMLTSDNPKNEDPCMYFEHRIEQYMNMRTLTSCCTALESNFDMLLCFLPSGYIG